MKLVSFLRDDEDKLGIYVSGKIYPVTDLGNDLPDNMQDFLWAGEDAMKTAKNYDKKIKSGDIDDSKAINESDAVLLSPVPFPTSLRDAYAFRQHVASARKNRGVDMIPEFDQFPVFYHSNHNAVQGPGPLELMPDHFDRLDFELEVAAVVGKKGRNIKADEADKYIVGYMVFNDLSARQLQMEEMKLNLGPAKGKDFSNIFGPYFVTKDELEDKKVSSKEGHKGANYNLKMTAWLNNEKLSEGNMADMDWTFAEIIERVSYGVDVLPGDVIGSGTVGTGCLLELNGTFKRQDSDYVPKWLKEGDVVELEIEGLGRLKTDLKKVKTDYSLLSLKKNLQKA